MVSAMVAKHVKHVALIAEHVGHQFVAMDNVMVVKHHGLVHKIVGLLILAATALVMVMKIHIHAHRTVDHPITVETTHVVQVKTVIVAHRIVDPVHQPIHVQTLTTFSLERHVSMLKWLLSVLALQVLHRRLHKLLVELPPKHIHHPILPLITQLIW